MAIANHEGFLLVDKPAGLSSHDVVTKVRRARGGIRGGHTGTLDPFATGLLLVALGRATRLIRFVPSEPKVYRASIVFGAATDTDDATGNVVEEGAVPDRDTVLSAIPRLTGRIEQVPPAYSARHVDGRRAYEVARTGQQPELRPASVVVHGWDVEALGDATLQTTISCSSGTYIRALARDLGRLCGSVAHLASLRRTRIGPFDVRDAILPDDSAEAPLVSAADALVGMSRQVIAGEDLVRLAQGRRVMAQEEGAHVALVDEAGALLAIGERDGTWWQPRVVISDG
jgi:tRNA pseudouridine55 synthase